jgi:hypothetical protein
VLLKPLPVFDPDRFVMLLGTWVTEKGERQSFSDASPAKFEHWRRQSSVIHDVSAFLPGLMNFTGGEVAEQVRSLQASADFFHCWGYGPCGDERSRTTKIFRTVLESR